MPAVVPFVIGFLSGSGAGILLVRHAWLIAPAFALVALLSWRRRGTIALLATGAAAGTLWAAGAEALRSTDCRLAWRDGQRVTILAEPRDLDLGERPPRYTIRRVHPAAAGRCAGAIRLAPRGGDSLPSGPAVVVGTWRRTATPGWRPVPPERRGMLVVSHWRHDRTAPSLRSRLRLGAERRMLTLFGPSRAALATALTVSPETALPQAERDEFTRAGLAHVLSISGFHVGVLAGGLILILRSARLSPDAARLGGTGMVAAYVWLLGFPAPAVRAAAMLGLWAVARLRQRPVEWRAMLAVAALLVFGADPHALFLPGPWLSFCGVYGCIAAAAWARLARPGRGRLARLIKSITLPVAVSVGAALATAPVTIAAFGTAAPVSLFSNLVGVPLAAFAVPAVALALLFASLPLPGAASLAAFPAAAAGLALDGLAWVTRIAVQVPFGQVEFQGREVAALVCALVAGLVLRRPDPAAGGRAALRLVARAVMAALLIVTVAAWRPALSALASGYPPGWLALHFLAVGQGDAIAIRTPAGRWLLLDGGPRSPTWDAGERVVVPFLRRERVRRLELVAASHGDADHLGGLPAVLAQLQAVAAIEPGEPLPRDLYREWLAAIRMEGAVWRRAAAGDVFDIDGVRVRVWHPDSAFLARRLPANENSLVLTIEFGGFRAVFPGDAGKPMEAERARQIGRVTLLKVGHHGSRSSTGQEWLASLRPGTCIIPVGINRYGHPAPEVLGALDRAGCAIWRTDRDGTVTVLTNGRDVSIRGRSRDTTFVISQEHP